MIGLDTNVLVRYLVMDDPAQSKKASAAIKAAVDRNEPLCVCSVVLCELVWVLASAYNCEKDEITDVLEKILLTEQFHIENQDEAWLALNDYKLGRADFSDYYMGRLNRRNGCLKTLTFDQELQSSDLFELL